MPLPALVTVALLAGSAGVNSMAAALDSEPSRAAAPEASSAPSPPAEEKAPEQGPWRDDPGVVREAEPGLSGVVLIVDGTMYDGRIASLEGGKVTVRVDQSTTVVARTERVRGVVEEVVLPYGTTSRHGAPEARLVLDDGSVVGGRLVESGPGGLVLDSPATGRREFDPARVKRVIRFSEAMRPMEPSPRYLEAPSAFLPRPGEIHIASTDVVHLTAAVGATDFLVVSAGTVVPALRADDYGSNVQAAVRAGLTVTDLWRVAAGVHVTASDRGKAAGYLSATATFGSPAAHVTLHAGPTFPGANLLGDFGDLGIALCGSLTVAPWADLVSENWVSRSQGNTDAFLALAGRFRFGRGAFDLGASVVAREGTVRPWLGITVDVTP